MSNLFDSFLNTSSSKGSGISPTKPSSDRKSEKDEVKASGDPFLTGFAAGPSDEKFTDSDGRAEEIKIPELDTLSKFTIPKKKKARKDLLEPVALNSREFSQEIFPVICKSYKDRNSVRNYKYTKAYLVHNEALLQTFQDRRKEMRSDGYSEKDLTDNYGFQFVSDEPKVKQLCKDGAKVGNVRMACLGNPDMAVCLCRHADILRPEGMVHSQTGIMVIFKYLRGKVKSLMENRGSFVIDPTPNYDCHVSKSANVDLTHSSPQQAFESTQVYLYEYDDYDIADKPRQICPYAVVYFTYVGDTKLNKPQPQKQLPKASSSSLRMGGHRAVGQAMPPSPLSGIVRSPLASPASPASTGSKSGPNTPQPGVPSPLPLAPPLSPAPVMNQPHPNQLHRSLSSSGLKQHPTLPRTGSWPGSQPMKLPPSPAMSPADSRLVSPKMMPSPNQYQHPQHQQKMMNRSSPAMTSPGQVMASPSQRSPMQSSPASQMHKSPVPSSPASIQQSPSSQATSTTTSASGPVVWSGMLTNKAKTLCKVELVSLGKALKPCRLGTKLVMENKVSQSELMHKYFSEPGQIVVDREVMIGGRYISYCQLRPAKDESAKFTQFIDYLVKRDCAATVILEDKNLFIMSNCELSCQLGLSYETDPILHCLFISTSSREQQLIDITSKIQNAQASGSDIMLMDLQQQTEVKLEDSFKKFVPVESLIYKDVLVKAFKEQAVIQEKGEPEQMKAACLQMSQQLVSSSAVSETQGSILRNQLISQTPTPVQHHQQSQNTYHNVSDLHMQLSVNNMNMGIPQNVSQGLPMYQHGHNPNMSMANMQYSVNDPHISHGYGGVNHGFMPHLPPMTHAQMMPNTTLSMNNMGRGPDPRIKRQHIMNPNMDMNLRPATTSLAGPYMTSQYDPSLPMDNAGLDSYLAAPHSSMQPRDPRLAQQNPNLSKSLSVGATPLKSGARQTPGIITTCSTMSTATTRGSKPRPAEGRTADSDTSSQQSSRGLACNTLNTLPLPPPSSFLSSNTSNTSTNDYTPSPSVPVYIPTPKSALQNSESKIKESCNRIELLNDENDKDELDDEDVENILNTSPPESPTHFGTGLLPATISGNPELTDDLVDAIVRGPLLAKPSRKVHHKPEKEKVTTPPSTDSVKAEATDNNNTEPLKQASTHRAKRTGPAPQKSQDFQVISLTDNTQPKTDSLEILEPLIPIPDKTNTEMSSRHSSSESSEYTAPKAESIASLSSSLQEVIHPKQLDRKARLKKRRMEKWLRKYKEKGVTWDAGGAEVFTQAAISAGPEPDDIQVTFSWDTEPDWDPDQELSDNDLREDCVISVLARQVKERQPEKNWDQAETEEERLMTDFWFHFIHYLEPCSPNDENIPPGVESRRRKQEVKWQMQQVGLDVSCVVVCEPCVLPSVSSAAYVPTTVSEVSCTSVSLQLPQVSVSQVSHTAVSQVSHAQASSEKVSYYNPAEHLDHHSVPRKEVVQTIGKDGSASEKKNVDIKQIESTDDKGRLGSKSIDITENISKLGGLFETLRECTLPGATLSSDTKVNEEKRHRGEGEKGNGKGEKDGIIGERQDEEKEKVDGKGKKDKQKSEAKGENEEEKEEYEKDDTTYEDVFLLGEESEENCMSPVYSPLLLLPPEEEKNSVALIKPNFYPTSMDRPSKAGSYHTEMDTDTESLLYEISEALNANSVENKVQPGVPRKISREVETEAASKERADIQEDVSNGKAASFTNIIKNVKPDKGTDSDSQQPAFFTGIVPSKSHENQQLDEDLPDDVMDDYLIEVNESLHEDSNLDDSSNLPEIPFITKAKSTLSKRKDEEADKKPSTRAAQRQWESFTDLNILGISDYGDMFHDSRKVEFVPPSRKSENEKKSENQTINSAPQRKNVLERLGPKVDQDERRVFIQKSPPIEGLSNTSKAASVAAAQSASLMPPMTMKSNAFPSLRKIEMVKTDFKDSKRNDETRSIIVTRTNTKESKSKSEMRMLEKAQASDGKKFPPVEGLSNTSKAASVAAAQSASLMPPMTMKSNAFPSLRKIEMVKTDFKDSKSNDETRSTIVTRTNTKESKSKSEMRMLEKAQASDGKTSPPIEGLSNTIKAASVAAAQPASLMPPMTIKSNAFPSLRKIEMVKTDFKDSKSNYETRSTIVTRTNTKENKSKSEMRMLEKAQASDGKGKRPDTKQRKASTDSRDNAKDARSSKSDTKSSKSLTQSSKSDAKLSKSDPKLSKSDTKLSKADEQSKKSDARSLKSNAQLGKFSRSDSRRERSNCMSSQSGTEKRRFESNNRNAGNKRSRFDERIGNQEKNRQYLSGQPGQEFSSFGPVRGNNDNRHHPYRRSQVHYKMYSTPRDADQLLGLLTVSNYRQRHITTATSLGQRFSAINFRRNSSKGNMKYEDENDERYTLCDVENLGQRRQFAEQLDRQITVHHDPVSELEPAWAVERQAYQPEKNQQEDSEHKQALRNVRKGRYSDCWQPRPQKLRRGGIFHHIFDTDQEYSDSSDSGSEEYESDEYSDEDDDSQYLTSDDDTSTSTMGRRRRKRWPGLRYPLDIPRRFNPYLPNPTEDLPKLLEVQIISHKDPRLEDGLPRSSIYYVLTAEERRELELRQATHQLANSIAGVLETPRSPDTPMSPDPHEVTTREVKITIDNVKPPLPAPAEQPEVEKVSSWIEASHEYFAKDKINTKTEGQSQPLKPAVTPFADLVQTAVVIPHQMKDSPPAKVLTNKVEKQEHEPRTSNQPEVTEPLCSHLSVNTNQEILPLGGPKPIPHEPVPSQVKTEPLSVTIIPTEIPSKRESYSISSPTEDVDEVFMPPKRAPVEPQEDILMKPTQVIKRRIQINTPVKINTPAPPQPIANPKELPKPVLPVQSPVLPVEMSRHPLVPLPVEPQKPVPSVISSRDKEMPLVETSRCKSVMSPKPVPPVEIPVPESMPPPVDLPKPVPSVEFSRAKQMPSVETSRCKSVISPRQVPPVEIPRPKSVPPPVDLPKPVPPVESPGSKEVPRAISVPPRLDSPKSVPPVEISRPRPVSPIEMLRPRSVPPVETSRSKPVLPVEISKAKLVLASVDWPKPVEPQRPKSVPPVGKSWHKSVTPPIDLPRPVPPVEVSPPRPVPPVEVPPPQPVPPVEAPKPLPVQQVEIARPKEPQSPKPFSDQKKKQDFRPENICIKVSYSDRSPRRVQQTEILPATYRSEQQKGTLDENEKADQKEKDRFLVEQRERERAVTEQRRKERDITEQRERERAIRERREKDRTRVTEQRKVFVSQPKLVEKLKSQAGEALTRQGEVATTEKEDPPTTEKILESALLNFISEESRLLTPLNIRPNINLDFDVNCDKEKHLPRLKSINVKRLTSNRSVNKEVLVCSNDVFDQLDVLLEKTYIACIKEPKEQPTKSVEKAPLGSFEVAKTQNRKRKHSATHGHLAPMSHFSRHRINIREDRQMRQLFDSNEDDVYYILECMQNGDLASCADVGMADDFRHLQGLSLSTQLESTFLPDSMVTKRIYLEELKQWMTNKPLDTYMLGKIGKLAAKPGKVRPSMSTTKTAQQCMKEFLDQTYSLIYRQESTQCDDANVFPTPRNVTEDTVHQVFRQVNHYMEFLAKPKNPVLVEKKKHVQTGEQGYRTSRKHRYEQKEEGSKSADGKSLVDDTRNKRKSTSRSPSPAAKLKGTKYRLRVTKKSNDDDDYKVKTIKGDSKDLKDALNHLQDSLDKAVDSVGNAKKEVKPLSALHSQSSNRNSKADKLAKEEMAQVGAVLNRMTSQDSSKSGKAKKDHSPGHEIRMWEREVANQERNIKLELKRIADEITAKALGAGDQPPRPLTMMPETKLQKWFRGYYDSVLGDALGEWSSIIRNDSSGANRTPNSNPAVLYFHVLMNFLEQDNEAMKVLDEICPHLEAYADGRSIETESGLMSAVYQAALKQKKQREMSKFFEHGTQTDQDAITGEIPEGAVINEWGSWVMPKEPDDGLSNANGENGTNGQKGKASKKAMNRRNILLAALKQAKKAKEGVEVQKVIPSKKKMPTKTPSQDSSVLTPEEEKKIADVVGLVESCNTSKTIVKAGRAFLGKVKEILTEEKDMKQRLEDWEKKQQKLPKPTFDCATQTDIDLSDVDDTVLEVVTDEVIVGYLKLNIKDVAQEVIEELQQTVPVQATMLPDNTARAPKIVKDNGALHSQPAHAKKIPSPKPRLITAHTATWAAQMLNQEPVMKKARIENFIIPGIDLPADVYPMPHPEPEPEIYPPLPPELGEAPMEISSPGDPMEICSPDNAPIEQESIAPLGELGEPPPPGELEPPPPGELGEPLPPGETAPVQHKVKAPPPPPPKLRKPLGKSNSQDSDKSTSESEQVILRTCNDPVPELPETTDELPTATVKKRQAPVKIKISHVLKGKKGKKAEEPKEVGSIPTLVNKRRGSEKKREEECLNETGTTNMSYEAQSEVFQPKYISFDSTPSSEPAVQYSQNNYQFHQDVEGITYHSWQDPQQQWTQPDPWLVQPQADQWMTQQPAETWGQGEPWGWGPQWNQPPPVPAAPSVPPPVAVIPPSVPPPVSSVPPLMSSVPPLMSSVPPLMSVVVPPVPTGPTSVPHSTAQWQSPPPPVPQSTHTHSVQPWQSPPDAKVPMQSSESSSQVQLDSAKNVRMYVFNRDQTVCKNVEHVLEMMGARSFDPWCPELVRQVAGVEILIFIHQTALMNIHQMPNLLQLKQLPWIKFVLYDNALQVQHRSYTPIMRKGGVLLADDTSLLSIDPRTLQHLCNFMAIQGKVSVPWSLHVHKHVLDQLENMRDMASERLGAVERILREYQQVGVVEILQGEDWDDKPRPPQAYLPCLLKLQATLAHKFRHFILLTDLAADSLEAEMFYQHGLGVFSIPFFMQHIVEKRAYAPLRIPLPAYGLKSDKMFTDAPLSLSVDRLVYDIDDDTG